MWPKNKLITLRFFLLLFFIITRIRNQPNNENGINDNVNLDHSENMIHFIKCGDGDSIKWKVWIS